MAEFSKKNENGACNILIKGSFTFTDKKSFLDILDNKDNKTKGEPLKINLEQTNHIDSTALGLLLATRNKLGGNEANITLIIKKNADIKRLIEINKLTDLFSIE